MAAVTRGEGRGGERRGGEGRGGEPRGAGKGATACCSGAVALRTLRRVKLNKPSRGGCGLAPACAALRPDGGSFSVGIPRQKGEF